MKKILAIATALSICIGTSVTCFADGNRLGILSMSGISEEKLNENLNKSINDSPFSTYEYYDNYTDLITALDNGSVDAIELDEYSAEYLMSRKDGYVRYIPKDSKECQINYCLMFRETEDFLRDLASDAIQDMKVDGTLKKMRKTYLTDVINGAEPGIIDIEQEQVEENKEESEENAVQNEDISEMGEEWDEEENVKVVLTGGLPPIDYLMDDGTPGGFNNAVVMEIGNRIGWNITLVPADIQTRELALSSYEADAVFLSRTISQEGARTIQYDKPEGVILTKPYLVGTLYYVVKENSPLIND